MPCTTFLLVEFLPPPRHHPLQQGEGRHGGLPLEPGSVWMDGSGWSLAQEKGALWLRKPHLGGEEAHS